MKVLVEGEAFEEKEGVVQVKLRTGFGDPVIRVDKTLIRESAVALAQIGTDLEAKFEVMKKDGEGLTLSQRLSILSAVGLAP